MRPIFLALALVVFSACSTSEKRPNDRVMDEIENSVRLPKGAHPLRDYARYYAFKGKGQIEAVYTVPGPPPSGEEVCKDLDATLPPEEWRTVPCPKESPENGYLAAGQRRWMSDHRTIPLTPDAGCEEVSLLYDTRARAFTWLKCSESPSSLQ